MLRAHAARYGQLDPFSLEGLAPEGDPLLLHQVYLQACRFPGAWRLLGEAGLPAGAAVRVAVLDFGFALPHPDLPPPDGPPPQGTGPSTLGAPARSSSPDSVHPAGGSHGNQSLGLIGAVANDGLGIRGAAPGVSLLPFEAATPLHAARAVLGALRGGARVLNLSWDCAAHPALRSALRAASAAGCVVVLAVPNNGRDLDRNSSFPLSCAFPGMLAVMACETREPHAALPLSARGRRTVHLAAPGDSILTTVQPPHHAFVEGTSAAAPLASAAAALVLSRAPWLRGPEVVALLVATARRTPALAGVCLSGGVLDAEAAVRLAGSRAATNSGHTPKPNWPGIPRTQPVLTPANSVSACVPN